MWFTVGDIPIYVAEKSVVEKSVAEVTTEKTTAEKSTTEKAASEKAPEVKAAAEEIALEKDVIVYEIDTNVSYAINPLGWVGNNLVKKKQLGICEDDCSPFYLPSKRPSNRCRPKGGSQVKRKTGWRGPVGLLMGGAPPSPQPQPKLKPESRGEMLARIALENAAQQLEDQIASSSSIRDNMYPHQEDLPAEVTLAPATTPLVAERRAETGAKSKTDLKRQKAKRDLMRGYKEVDVLEDGTVTSLKSLTIAGDSELLPHTSTPVKKKPCKGCQKPFSKLEMMSHICASLQWSPSSAGNSNLGAEEFEDIHFYESSVKDSNTFFVGVDNETNWSGNLMIMYVVTECDRQLTPTRLYFKINCSLEKLKDFLTEQFPVENPVLKFREQELDMKSSTSSFEHRDTLVYNDRNVTIPRFTSKSGKLWSCSECEYGTTSQQTFKKSHKKHQMYDIDIQTSWGREKLDSHGNTRGAPTLTKPIQILAHQVYKRQMKEKRFQGDDKVVLSEDKDKVVCSDNKDKMVCSSNKELAHSGDKVKVFGTVSPAVGPEQPEMMVDKDTDMDIEDQEPCSSLQLSLRQRKLMNYNHEDEDEEDNMMDLDDSYADPVFDYKKEVQEEKSDDEEYESDSSNEEIVKDRARKGRKGVKQVFLRDRDFYPLTDASDGEEEEEKMTRHENREQRYNQMMNGDIPCYFQPTQEDYEWEQKFTAQLNKRSHKYLSGKIDMPLDVQQQLEKGQVLSRKNAKYGSDTPRQYILALRRLLLLWQEELKKTAETREQLINDELHFKNFYAFDKISYVKPYSDIIKLIEEGEKSLGMMQHMIAAYNHLLSDIYMTLQRPETVPKFMRKVNRKENETDEEYLDRKREEEERAEGLIEKEKQRISTIQKMILIEKPAQKWKVMQEAQHSKKLVEDTAFLGKVTMDPNVVIPKFTGSKYAINTENKIFKAANEGIIVTQHEYLQIVNYLVTLIFG